MNKTMPEIPKEFDIPTYTQPQKKGKAQAPGTPAFYYSGVQVLWCWYQVELEVLKPFLDKPHMCAADFGGHGAVNFNFMNAVALYGSGFPGNVGGSGFNETELNIVAYAKQREKDVPTDLSLQDYIFGADQTKHLGVYRLHVGCDSGVAIAAGKRLFYENKFFTAYKFTAPNLNRTVAQQMATADQWSITCYDGHANTDPEIYSANVDLQGLAFAEANASAVIDISYDKNEQRVLGSRRNFFGMHRVALLTDETASRVQVKYGTSSHQMRKDMETLIGQRPAYAAQVIASPPVIAEAVPYYMDIE